MRFKKVLSLVLTMVMIVGLMPTTAMATVSMANANPQLTKNAEWVDEESGLAKITLQAKGTPIVTPKKGADVVVVMDYSGSMGQCNEKVKWTYSDTYSGVFHRYDVYTGVCPNGHTYTTEVRHGRTPKEKICEENLPEEKTRWVASKNALTTLLNQIIPDSESENQVALVAFDSDVETSYTNGFTKNKNSIITTINNLSVPYPDYGKGTNYAAALQKAKEYINSRGDKSRDAYVVFLSDGEPDEDNEGTSEIQAIKRIKGVTVYTIGLALNSATAINLLQGYASKPEFFKNISTANDLDGIFGDIGQTIASGVTIWDTIDTRYFSVANKPGESVSFEASNGNDKVQFSNNKDFVWNFDNFSTAGETLEIYIQLKSEYLNTNANYPTNTAGSAKGEYVGSQGTKVNLAVTEDSLSSAVPQLPTTAVPTYTVTGTITNGNGTVTNGNQQNVSTSLEMVFTANPGYHIASITKNGTPQSLTGIRTSYVYPAGAVTENVTVNVATAQNPNVAITYTAEKGGTVSPESNSVPPATGSATGSTATPNPGFHFVNWTVGGVAVQTKANPILTKKEVDAKAKDNDGIYVPTEFTANFAEDSAVKITYEAVGGGSVNKAWEELNPSTGDAQGSTANMHAGLEFIGWATSDKAKTAAECISVQPKYIPSKVGGVYQSATYYAIFVEKDVKISYVSADTSMGSVSPTDEMVKAKNGKAKDGSTATPKAGYHFVKWTVDDKAVGIAGDPILTPGQIEAVAKKDGVYVETTFTANFAENDTVTITYTAGDGGTVKDLTTGGFVSQTSEEIAPVTGTAPVTTAKPNPGYSFDKWVAGETVVGSNETLTQEEVDAVAKKSGIYEATEIKAIFKENEVKITYKAGLGGKVTKVGTAEAVDDTFEKIAAVNGTPAGSKAIPNAGYHFAGWLIIGGDGNIISNKDELIPDSNKQGVYENIEYYATFIENEYVKITYTAGDGGSVDHDADVIAPATGEATGSTATATAGYSFVNWTVGNKEIGTDKVLTKEQVDDVAKNSDGIYVSTEITANFKENEKVKITYTAGDGGAVSNPADEIAPATGEATGSTATAKAGYHFVNWTVDDKEVGKAGDPILTSEQVDDVAKNSDGIYVATEIKANFKENEKVKITYTAGDGGTVSNPADEIAPATGEATGSTATAKAGYSFVNWTSNGEEVGIAGDPTLTPQQVDAVAKKSGIYVATEITANFKENVITITYKSGVGGKVTKVGTGESVDDTFEKIASVTDTAKGSKAIPDDGYSFVDWKKGDTAVVASGEGKEEYIPEKVNGVYEEATYFASFAKKSYTVTGSISNGHGTVESGGNQSKVYQSPSDPIVFKADTGYHIKEVSVNGGAPQKIEGILATYTYDSVEVTGNISVVVTTEINEYNVTGSINNGTATPETQPVQHGGNSQKIEFKAAPGYKITGATVGTDVVILEEGTTDTWEYTVTKVTKPTAVVVTTEEDDVEILYHAGDGGTVTRASETVKAVNGEPLGSTAVPNPGFSFVKWTFIEGAEVGTDATLVPSKGDSPVYIGGTYKAVFAEDEAVTIYYKAGKGGSVSSESELLLPATGEAVGSTATADTGYTIFNWTNSQGDVVSTSYECVPTKVDGVYVADTYTANFKPNKHSFVVEDIYQNLIGGKVDELHSITGNDPSEKVAFDSEISSAKNEYLRGYEYSDMQVFVDVNKQQATDEELLELGIKVDRENGTLTGKLPDHQIWVKYIYNEVQKYRADYTSEGEGKVTGIPAPITDAIPGDEITISKDIPVRDGFDFLEWIPQKNGDPIKVTDGKFIMPEGNVEIRASWKANAEIFNYDVKYYTEDGKLIATIPSTVLKSDPIVTSVENKAPEGYKLQGYIFNDGEMTRELSAEITENGQTISVYYEKNDLIVKHVYGTTTVYDSNQSKANLSVEDGNVVVNAVTSGRYTRITSAALNNKALGSVLAVTVAPDGESKYEVVFTYGTRSSSDSDDDNNYTPSNPGSSDDTPGDDVTIIEDPAVALQDGLESIDHYAYVFGYEDGTVRPENKVTREEVATIFYRLLTDGTRDALFTKEQDFPDVSSGRWSNVAIATLLNGKIVSGYPDGEFKPGNYITRAEFAAIVAKFDNLSYSGENKFSDIYAHWAANYINSAAIKGWISGYPDGTFHPDAYISRAEAITLINAVLGRQVSKEGLLPEAKYWSDNTADKWYYEAVMEATNSHDYEREADSNVEKWTALKEDKTWTER